MWIGALALLLLFLTIAAQVVRLLESQKVGLHIHLEKCLFGEDFNSPLQGHHMLEALPVHIQDLVPALQPFPSRSRALHNRLDKDAAPVVTPSQRKLKLLISRRPSQAYKPGPCLCSTGKVEHTQLALHFSRL